MYCILIYLSLLDIFFSIDLMALTSNKAKQKTLAQRLITLSDEVRTNKIAFLQQRRAVQVKLSKLLALYLDFCLCYMICVDRVLV